MRKGGNRIFLAVMTGAYSLAAQKPDTQNRLTRLAFGESLSQVYSIQELQQPVSHDIYAGEIVSEIKYPSNQPPVTNLAVWGISPTSDGVLLGIAWPRWTEYTNDLIDVFGNWRLDFPKWHKFASLNISYAKSNAVFALDWNHALSNAVCSGFFPSNSSPCAAFFRLDSQTDSDGDGLTDAEERWTFGTDPLSADTDGDGLSDCDETKVLCTNPLSMDSDGDGIPDCADPHPLASDGDCYGQSEDWVAASFPDSAPILAADYRNWVDSQVGVGLENGYYKITATLATPSTETTLVQVGDLAIMATNRGEFVFLCKKGVEYRYRVYPDPKAVVFQALDDLESLPVPIPQSAAAWGHWSDGGGIFFDSGFDRYGAGRFIWLPVLSGSPDITHFYPDETTKTFYATIKDICSDVPVHYTWTSSSGRIVISEPSSRYTSVSVNGMPSFERFDLSVRTDFGSWSVVSSINATCGTNSLPVAKGTISIPPAVMFTGEGSGAEAWRKQAVKIEFASDEPTNGILRLDALSGGDKIRLWRSQNVHQGFVTFPHAIALNDGATSGAWTYFIEGISPSEHMNDVRIRAEFIPSGRTESSNSCGENASLTVVNPLRIELPDAPETGLAVLKGDAIYFEVACDPVDYDCLDLSCDWFTGRRKGDGTYDDWSKIAGKEQGPGLSYAALTPGVFRLKAIVTIGYDTKEVRYVHMGEKPFTLVKAGDDDHFGVASTAKLLALRNAAIEWIGNPLFSLESNLPAYGVFSHVPQGKWKCNAFVAYIADSSGVTVPVCYQTEFFSFLTVHKYPPSANDWANGNNPHLTGWSYLGKEIYLEPGMVCGHPNSHGLGHCGIVDYDGQSIAGGTDEVNKAYEFLDGTSGYNIPEGGEDE